MADVKISALPPITHPLSGVDVLPIVQSGTTYKAALLGDLGDFLNDNAFRPANIVYVATNGDDTNGNGSSLAPYASITHAMAVTTSATPSNPVTIVVLGGIYNETALVIKDSVSLQGEGNPSINFINTITFDSAWTQSALLDLNISCSTFDFDTSSLSASSRQLFVYSCNLTGFFSYRGRGALNDNVIFENCIFNTNVGILAATNLTSNNLFVGDYSISTTPGNNSVVNHYGARIIGNGSFLGTAPASTTAVVDRCTFGGSLTIDGANTLATIDVVSFKTPILLNGGHYSLVNIADGILNNYSPVNYTNVSPDVQGALHGIDNALGSVTFTSPQQVVYVAKNGNDSTGTGGFNKPFLTISHAISTITTATTSNRFAIHIMPGTYSEAGLTLKPYVNLVGEGLRSTIISLTADMILGSGFNSASSQQINFSNLVINAAGGNIIFDSHSFTPGNRVFDFTNCLVAASTTITANNGSTTNNELLRQTGTLYTGPVAISDIYVECQACNFRQTLTIQNLNGGGNTVAEYVGCRFGAAVLVNSSNGTNTTTAYLMSSFFDTSATLTVDQAHTTAVIDTDTYIVPTITNSATVTLNSISNGLKSNYSPTNYTAADASVHGALVGIDNALGSIVSTGNNVVYVAKNGNDSTGNGSFANPFLTISHAMATITTASPSNLFVIYVQPGTYTDSSLSWKANVSLAALSNQVVTYTVSGAITNAADWGTGNSSVSANNITINAGSWSFDTHLTTTTRALLFINSNLAGPITYNGNNNAHDRFVAYSCQIAGATVLDSMTIIMFNTWFFNTFTSTSSVGNSASLIQSNKFNTTVTFTSSTGNNVITLTNSALNPSATLNATGSGVTLTLDVDTYIANIIPSGGATINLTSVANGILNNYTPTNYTNFDSSIYGALIGIDNALGQIDVAPVANVKYVSINGSDITGTGSLINPYQTVAAATASITTASVSNRFAIHIFPGDYTETGLTLKPYVMLTGDAYRSTRILLATDLTLDAAWGTGAAQCQISGLAFVNAGGNINLDASAMAAQSRQYIFFDCTPNCTTTIKGLSGTATAGDQLFWFSNVSTGATLFSNVSGRMLGSQFSAALHIANNSGTGNCNMTVVGCNFSANVTIDATNGSLTTTANINSCHSESGVTINVDQSTATLNIDTDSYTSLTTATSGATLNLASIANGLASNYSPVNYTATDSSVKGALQGIDNALGSVSPFVWTTITGTTQAIAVNNGYISNNASSLITFTLPATASVGDYFRIIGKGNGKFTIHQNAGQSIHIGSSVTTTGAGGSLTSTDAHDSISVVCITANTEFSMLSAPEGNFTVV